MEQQSSNKLDALFQKAAKEYPLKTDNKNWDIVADKLRSGKNTQSTKNRRWQYGLILLLFLGGSFFIFSNLIKKSFDAHGNEKKILSQKNNSNQVQAKYKSEKNSKLKYTNNHNLKQNIVKNKTVLQFDIKNINAESRKQIKSTSTSNTNLLNETDNNLSQHTQQLQQPKLIAGNLTREMNLFNQNKIELNSSTIINKDIAQNFKKTDNSYNSTTKKNEHINLRPQPKTFYGMLFFSPDFSTVKFQHINKPGYSIGIALGYRINNRISIELGLQRIHTNFYSDGKYFDTSNLKIKRVTSLNDLNGNNKLTAVPVAVRFNLFKSNHFFATTGTNVAVITHTEKYNYDVIKNGTPRNINKKFSALTGTKFFSSANVSFGYQTSVSNLFDVKVEPYYQVAIKGLVSNFGVNVGIIKNLK